MLSLAQARPSELPLWNTWSWLLWLLFPQIIFCHDFISMHWGSIKTIVSQITILHFEVHTSTLSMKKLSWKSSEMFPSLLCPSYLLHKHQPYPVWMCPLALTWFYSIFSTCVFSLPQFPSVNSVTLYTFRQASSKLFLKWYQNLNKTEQSTFINSTPYTNCCFTQMTSNLKGGGHI